MFCGYFSTGVLAQFVFRLSCLGLIRLVRMTGPHFTSRTPWTCARDYRCLENAKQSVVSSPHQMYDWVEHGCFAFVISKLPSRQSTLVLDLLGGEAEERGLRYIRCSSREQCVLWSYPAPQLTQSGDRQVHVQLHLANSRNRPEEAPLTLGPKTAAIGGSPGRTELVPSNTPYTLANLSARTKLGLPHTVHWDP